MSGPRGAEHAELASVIRRFFTSAGTVDAARAALDLPDGGLGQWKRMTDELDLPGLAIEESLGGQGFGLPELVVVAEEAGRALAGGPLFATTMLAAPVLDHVATGEHRRSLLAAAASGAVIALAHRDAGREVGDIVTSVRGGRAFGCKVDVLAADLAERIVVVARDEDGALAAFTIDPSDAAVEVRPQAPLDGSRPTADVLLDGASVERISDGDVTIALARGLDVARVCLAAEMVGAGGRCLERTLEHLRTREQFGRPIGAFQELQHRAVDVLVALELTQAGLRYAVDVVGAGTSAPSVVSMVAAQASEAFRLAAAEEIQFMGGMGVAWESAAHLYFRRAMGSVALLGSPSWHRRRIASCVTKGK